MQQMPQKMRRNATINISAPTGKTAVIKMPSPSARAHSPAQRHGPKPGGRGPKPEYMALLPLSFRRLPVPFYTKAPLSFLLHRGKAPKFPRAFWEVLDIFPPSCNIKATLLHAALRADPRTARIGKDGTSHAGNEQQKPAFYRFGHPQNDTHLQRVRRDQSGAGLPRF